MKAIAVSIIARISIIGLLFVDVFGVILMALLVSGSSFSAKLVVGILVPMLFGLYYLWPIIKEFVAESTPAYPEVQPSTT